MIVCIVMYPVIPTAKCANDWISLILSALLIIYMRIAITRRRCYLSKRIVSH